MLSPFKKMKCWCAFARIGERLRTLPEDLERSAFYLASEGVSWRTISDGSGVGKCEIYLYCSGSAIVVGVHP